MDEQLERIRRAEEQLATQATWSEDEPARVRRRIRASIAGTVILALLAFIVLIPVGAALGFLARVVARMLNG
jgi:multidrug efflux pump subunit AcrA (membrane-fusion protein)